MRRAHVRYSDYSRYCEYLHEIPEYRKSMLSALPAENLKRTRHGGSPPERQRIPRPGRVPSSHDIPIDFPRGTVGRYGTRSTRVRRRRTRSGVGGRAGAVSGRRRARRGSAAQRVSARRRRSAHSEHPEHPEYPEYPDGPLRRTGYLLALLCWSYSRGTLLVLSARHRGTLGTHTDEPRLDSRGRYSGWHRER